VIRSASFPISLINSSSLKGSIIGISKILPRILLTISFRLGADGHLQTLTLFGVCIFKMEGRFLYVASFYFLARSTEWSFRKMKFRNHVCAKCQKQFLAYVDEKSTICRCCRMILERCEKCNTPSSTKRCQGCVIFPEAELRLRRQ
jgi:hypothetical protein